MRIGQVCEVYGKRGCGYGGEDILALCPGIENVVAWREVYNKVLVGEILVVEVVIEL